MIVTKRKNYAQWLKKYSLFNLFIIYLFSTVYLLHLPLPNDQFSTYFSITAYLGQIGVLYFLTLLPIVFLLLVYPNFFTIIIFSLFLNIFVQIIFAIDILLYAHSSFHINFLLLKVIFSLEAIRFFGLTGFEVGLILFLLSIIGIVEILAAYFFWKKNQSIKIGSFFLWVLMVAIAAEVVSQLIYAYGYAINHQKILQNSRAFPFYKGLEANDTFIEYNILTEEEIIKHSLRLDTQGTHKLNYPKNILKGPLISNPPNIIVILIDAWRFDSFTEQSTPNIFKFSKKASVFHNHFSGGNATLPGLYTLFYSIPASYWNATTIPPVLFDQLVHYKYQQKALMSAGMKFPPFYKNIFLTVNDIPLTIEGDTPDKRDDRITQDALTFIQESSNKQSPFFLFLFYDSAHGSSVPSDYPLVFKPVPDINLRVGRNAATNPEPYLNLYKNAVHYNDNLIGKILSQLKSSNLMDNTIVIITSDHGEEFNDNQENYWGHVSNFTQFQTKIPLIFYYPGHTAKQINYQTSSYDIVPSLLQNVFKIKNPTSDYSIGENLFIHHNWKYLPVSSYDFAGLITPNNIYNFYPLGVTAIYSLKATLLLNSVVDPDALSYFMKVSAAYYKKN